MYLVLPIQRIPRYILLLQEILKYTSGNHGDYNVLVTVLQKMKQIATYVILTIFYSKINNLYNRLMTPNEMLIM